MLLMLPRPILKDSRGNLHLFRKNLGMKGLHRQENQLKLTETTINNQLDYP